MRTTAKERCSAWSIKRKERKAEKKRMLQQEKKEGEVAAVTPEVLQQLGLPYNPWISILYKSRNAEHEQSMHGKLLYTNDPIFKDYYTIDRLGIVYIWDKKAKRWFLQSAAVLQMNYLSRNMTVSAVCLCIYTTTPSFMQLLPTMEHWYMEKYGVLDGNLGLTKAMTMENMQKA
jgi:hypothetical protein